MTKREVEWWSAWDGIKAELSWQWQRLTRRLSGLVDWVVGVPAIRKNAWQRGDKDAVNADVDAYLDEKQ
jgi:hypothetical protein